MPELRLEELSVAHLEPVSLTVKPGEIVCVSGESGSGKSLLLRAITDIIPHEGQVYLDEQAASSMSGPAWRHKVGLLPAESHWWKDGIGQHFINQDTRYFSELGLKEEAIGWQVSRCSTGEKQRLALLRLLDRKPSCLLLDEPTGSLDPASTERVERLIKHLASKEAYPVLWVSHSHEQIARVADRHFVMHNGRLTRDD